MLFPGNPQPVMSMLMFCHFMFFEIIAEWGRKHCRIFCPPDDLQYVLSF